MVVVVLRPVGEQHLGPFYRLQLVGVRQSTTTAVARPGIGGVTDRKRRLRARGSLETVTTRITTKLSEIMGLQAALAAIAVSQGIGPKASKRITATGLFQLSLSMAWLFSLAIFDVSGIDPHLAATKLRLGLVEGSALFFTGLMVLCGFSAYVLSEQSQPNVNTIETLWGVFAVAIFGGFCCTARVVWVARRRRRSKVCDSDPEPPA